MGKVLLAAVLTLFAALTHGGTSSTGIIFNGNGGKVSYGDQQNRDSVKVPAIQQAPTVFYCLPEQVTVTPPLGKRFERWYDDAQLQRPTFIQPYTGGITAWENEYTPVYAGWNEADYYVVFHANAGEGTMLDQKQLTGIAGNLSSNAFTHVNHHFVGWAPSESGQVKYADGAAICLASDPPYNDTAKRYEYHLYAVWEENVYPVVYCSNDEHNYLKTNAVVVSENKILTNPFSRQGYEFVQWNTKADGSGNTYDAGSECSYIAPEFPSGLFLYALWTPRSYRVTFSANGRGTPSFLEKEVVYDEPYGELPTCAFEGYDFVGWFTKKTEGERIEATNIVKITATQNLYAHWSGKSHQVSFDVGGGEAVAPMTVTYQSTYGELPTPLRKGYEFDGWFTATTGGDRILATTTVSSMTAETLFAHWTPIAYRVEFAANGGDGEMAAQDFTYDVAAALVSNVYVRTQYRFVGWADTNAVVYADGAVVSNLTALANDTFVLTAQWEPLPASELSQALDTEDFYFVSESSPAWFVTNLAEMVHGSCVVVCASGTSSQNPAILEARFESCPGGTLSFSWRAKDLVSKLSPDESHDLSLQIEGVDQPEKVTLNGSAMEEHTCRIPPGCTWIRFCYYSTNQRKADGCWAFIDNLSWMPDSPAVIEVGPDDISVTVQEGQTLCFKKDGYDITDFLDFPEPVNGVLDLTQVTVKAEYANEPLDPAQGAVLVLNALAPSLTTAPTRAGLTYILYEGVTLDDLKPGAQIIGNGESWIPKITVKGEPSAFYTVKVTQYNE